uniref:Ig-like domain-containing protein n=1 Tax=Fundulus heteroclitus TaxID=8078 RepID=A0A3Q2PNF0_FUNHE
LSVMVKLNFFVFFLPGTHSLKYFYTASSGIANFPSYVSVGLVDDVQISYCDSHINRNIPKQEWMKKVESDHPRYWREETQTCLEKQQTFRENLDVAKHRFNQTEGAHIFQQMIGCEWEDETGDVSGYDQFGYDGEDFIILDLRTQTWIAPKQQAVITKNKWNNDRYAAEYEKSYLTQICVEWLKKYVNYGRSSLLRTDLPSVSFLQKNSRSPVSCHATGFYPNRAEMFWRKDGEEVHDGVVKGEILPNNDGTFQMSVDINLSSVKPEDWNKYECVFQLSGVNDINRLGKSKIRSNECKKPNNSIFWCQLAEILMARKKKKPRPSIHPFSNTLIPAGIVRGAGVYLQLSMGERRCINWTGSQSIAGQK